MKADVLAAAREMHYFAFNRNKGAEIKGESDSNFPKSRLYFYKESLFRWIQTSAEGTAVTYDNEWTNEAFLRNESMAINDVKKIINKH